MLNLTDDIIAYESGELDFDATVELFHQLLTSGMIYHLQGTYQRTAQNLLDRGLINL